MIKPASSLKPLTKQRAILELIVAGLFWGFGFVGTVWTLQGLGPSAVIFYRFLISFITAFLILLWRKTPRSLLLNEMGLALIPGVFLWLTLILQTWGLQYTTATNSTFITTLYVVIVPLMHSWTGQEKLGWAHWLCVALALIGTGFIVQIQNLTSLNGGDLMTFLCAIFAAIHILVIGQRALKTKDDFAFNAFQSFWMAGLSLLCLPFTGKWSLGALNLEGWIGLLCLGFGSSLLAFFFQIRAQKVLSPSVSSLLFLLESPISCVFAYFLLNETLNPWQWLGALFILISCAFVSLSQTQITKS